MNTPNRINVLREANGLLMAIEAVHGCLPASVETLDQLQAPDVTDMLDDLTRYADKLRILIRNSK